MRSAGERRWAFFLRRVTKNALARTISAHQR
jgi:hypothetical protein